MVQAVSIEYVVAIDVS